MHSLQGGNFVGKLTQSVRRIVKEVKEDPIEGVQSREEVIALNERLRKVSGLLDSSFGLAKQALLDLHKKFDCVQEGGNVFTRYKLMKRMIKVAIYGYLAGNAAATIAIDRVVLHRIEDSNACEEDTTMTSAAPLACAVCSVKFEDLDSLLQHMATGHAASSAPPPAAATASGQPASTRQIVLSRTAFLRLKPLLQQGAGRGVVTIVTQRGGGAATVARRPIRPRPPKPAASDGALDVEVLEPSEPPAPSEPAGQQPPIDPDWIECCVCRRRFKHKYSLVAHCRQHIMSRLCGVCHRRLPDGQALVEHLETHMEKNSSFKCDQCDKSFVHAKSLYVHKRNHSGVRPYTCQYCHKTFRHWHKHRVHVRIHTGERPYRCDVCGWGFPRNDECKRHMRTHVGQKAFHCVDCGVGCGTQIALMRHQELHHGKRRPSMEGETQDSAEATEERRGELEPSGADADKAADSFADLDDNVTVKVEMDNFSLEEHDADASVEANAEGIDASEGAADYDAGADGGEDDDDVDDDPDDPSYQPDSDSGSGVSGYGGRRNRAPGRSTQSVPSPADAGEEEEGSMEETDPLAVPGDQQPQKDPIAIGGQGPEHLPEPVIQPVMVIKEEPRDSDEEITARAASPAAAAPWDADSSSELDEANVSLLEPEVNLTELFIDIERMRSTIRRKIAENAHKFEDAVTQKARSYVRDREPSIANMRSILRAKLEEGKRIQALLSSQETEKRQVKIESVSPRKKIKTEPEDADDSLTLNSDNIAGTSTATDLNNPDSKLALERSRRLPPSVGLGFRRRGRPPKEFLRGRKSDPSATPRVPRRRWIQHELNFSTEEDGLDETAQLGGVRISTGFGEL
ncbi:Gastrula zinc finger protein XlCGF64.1 [Amphibalanus amphitrite]|uniref:Gastrula zinc finger protein XlCGF64.1 n=1 Tax=Amphibalanus amphitrite TaxID=1232801 RepID=A0A6A4WTE1_AMPAM|nr:Gastrula zinc finger protein XlCGF64.1 [Amphibalanus amphitrite]